MTGQTISHYRILAKLGEGAMGVVYRAEDTKLRRNIALKFLPDADGNAALRDRFLREAQAAAALNHPNICTIFEIDEERGFLAMELVEGPSLKDKIAERPLKLDEALDFASQIAASLQAAHDKGVTHRDIKPANILLTQQGQVKITDFGLAALADRSRITKTGSSMGTPAYMSPEQAKGKPLDRRTDLWSLGVVLYEMLTGRLPFAGDTEQAVSYGIVHTDPEPPTALRSGLPVEIDRVTAKALAKNPAERYQNAADLQVDLRGVAANRQAAHSPKASARTRGPLVYFAAGSLVALVAVGVFSVVTKPPDREPSGHELRLSVLPPEGGTFPQSAPAISPDGRLLAFAVTTGDTTQLWIRPMDSPEAKPLAGTESPGSLPFWSPDSRFLAWVSQGSLKRIRISGNAASPVQTICQVAEPLPFGGTWNRDGVILFGGTSTDGLYRVSADGGEPVRITRLDPARREGYHSFPDFLPDGRQFLYFVGTNPREGSGVYVSSLDAPGKGAFLVRADSTARYLHPGRIVFVRGGVLLVQRFDAENRKMIGEAEPVANRVTGFTSGRSLFSTSANGVLVYRQLETNLPPVWFERSGRELGWTSPQGEYRNFDLSPDGRLLAFDRMEPHGSTYNVWVLDLSRGTVSRFTETSGSLPRWSLDGTRIVFSASRTGQRYPALYQKAAAGNGGDDLLASRPDRPSLGPEWTPDGQFILYEVVDGTTGGSRDLWIVPVAHPRKPIPLLQTSFDEADCRVSPDGRWIAYTSDETGRREVYIRQFLGYRALPEERTQVSVGGGSAPVWRRDGKEFYYLTSDDRVIAIPVNAGGGLNTQAAKPLFAVAGGAARFAVSPDGNRFLVSKASTSPVPITVVVNLGQQP